MVAEQLRTAAAAARQGDRGSAMTHAWLFTGPPGSGRSVAAVAFAAALQCISPTLGCGQCEQCVAVRRNAHSDVLHIVPKTLSIGVELMRDDVVVPASKAPTVGRWRVVILDNADRLTTESANTLLKTVEEPPAHTVIIFCAPSDDPRDFIPTLRSRSRHVYIPQPTTKEVVELLGRQGIAESVAQLAATSTSNNIGRARRLIEDVRAQQLRDETLNLAELIFHRDTAFQAVTAIIKNRTKAATENLDEENAAEVEQLRQALGMGARGKGVHKALQGSNKAIKDLEEVQKKRKTRAIRDMLDMGLTDLAGLYRDALILASGRENLMHPDKRHISEEVAAKVGAPGIVACIDAVMDCREKIAISVRPEAAFDAMVGKLRKAYRVH
ncbi:DNA polymerase III delta prime subunit [Corynebacterium kutscheri]|uniref:DNA polymerase III delta prime subunit n=1 Tax=Corynebacterium kutscheri TaxID=35755 RepID=A0A0F6QY97_9CORY|nr:DNA polymerase III, delta subunit [Corynebacterium kutscheri]VEH05210.1 DNA polymerase III delta prime subunit [Corynebacterium kutscheri]VEH10830.1 DNA polymerase III delta prime subunit [Corynebacterium kutscheri]VEH80691.1 DNA polymerase III delta prime subunit [Corynebacterium kutscheri]